MSNTFKELSIHHESVDDIEKYVSSILEDANKYIQNNDNYKYLFKNFYLINRIISYVYKSKASDFVNRLYELLKDNEDKYYHNFMNNVEIGKNGILGSTSYELAYDEILFDILLFYNLYRIYGNRIFKLSNDELNELISLYYEYVNKDDSEDFYCDYKISEVDELGDYIFDENIRSRISGMKPDYRQDLISDASLNYFNGKKAGSIKDDLCTYLSKCLKDQVKDVIIGAVKEALSSNITMPVDVYYYFSDFIYWIANYYSSISDEAIQSKAYKLVDDLEFLKNLCLNTHVNDEYITSCKGIISDKTISLYDKFDIIVDKAYELEAKKLNNI